MEKVERYEKLMPELVRKGKPKKFENEREARSECQTLLEKKEIIQVEVIKTSREDEMVYADLGAVIGAMPFEEVSFRQDLDGGQAHHGRAEKLIGCMIDVCVKKVTKNDIVLSRKAATEQILKDVITDIDEGTIHGKRLKGVVTGYTPDKKGLFLDIGSDLEGILGIYDSTYDLIEHAQEIGEPGDVLDVVVKKAKNDPLPKFDFSRKELIKPPSEDELWATVHDYLKRGDQVVGVVKKKLQAGYLVKVLERYYVYVDFRKHLHFEYGDKAKVRIVAVDPGKRKIRGRFAIPGQ